MIHSNPTSLPRSGGPWTSRRCSQGAPWSSPLEHRESESYSLARRKCTVFLHNTSLRLSADRHWSHTPHIKYDHCWLLHCASSIPLYSPLQALTDRSSPKSSQVFIHVNVSVLQEPRAPSGHMTGMSLIWGHSLVVTWKFMTSDNKRTVTLIRIIFALGLRTRTTL